MHKTMKWVLYLGAASVVFGGGCGFGGLGGSFGSFGTSTTVITLTEVFDIGLGVLVGSFLGGAGLAT